VQEQKQTIAIVGASGYVGHNLICHLLETTNYTIKALCPRPERVVFEEKSTDRVELIANDVFDTESLAQALTGSTAAVYLVHMMGVGGDYYELEARAATSMAEAAKAAHVERIIFMGGLGNDADKLSHHLASRHNSGRILAEIHPKVIELRASMIVGHGSISFDIVKNLVDKLPVQTMPQWAVTATQPIILKDALDYLTESITVPISQSAVVEIGGPEQLSYKDLVRRYALWKGKKPVLIVVPLLPLGLGALWLNLFTPKMHAHVGRQIVESLVNPMVVTTNTAKELFPNIHPQPIEKGFELAAHDHWQGYS
jgi:uncharacterized protein YbjT (DUF2867 family)